MASKLFGKKISHGKIPDRWIPYKACGNVIEGTRIICFKVPLNKKVQVGVPGITKIWDIPAVLNEIPNLGAVIDLTNTARYYNPRDFVAADVLHTKILMPGREIPPESKVQEFIDAVDEFLGKDCDSLVGVHCTHGLNRTGYMVCRYMRDRLNIPANDAIKKFEKARGYQMERKIYIDDLLGNKVHKAEPGKETNIADVDNEIVEVNPVDYGTYDQNGYDSYKNNWRDRSKQNSFFREGYTRNRQYVTEDTYYSGDTREKRSNRDKYLSWRLRGENNNQSGQSSGKGSWRYKSRVQVNNVSYRPSYSYKYDY